jgi:hypothetical protein
MRLFGQEWKVWSLQGLIYFLASGLLLIPGLAMMWRGLAIGIADANAAPESTAGLIEFMTGFGLLFGGGCVGSFLHVFLLGGMYRTARKQLRGEPIAFADIFSAGDVYWPLLGAFLLQNLAHSLASQVCGLASLALAALWVFVHPLIVEGKMGLSEAFTVSWNVAKQNFLFYVGFVLVAGVVALAGYLVGCGAVATLPIATIMVVVAYRDTFERAAANSYGVAPQMTPMTPPVYYGPAGAPSVGGNCPACGRLTAAGAVVCPSCGAQLTGGLPPDPMQR